MPERNEFSGQSRQDTYSASFPERDPAAQPRPRARTYRSAGRRAGAQGAVNPDLFSAPRVEEKEEKHGGAAREKRNRRSLLPLLIPLALLILCAALGLRLQDERKHAAAAQEQLTQLREERAEREAAYRAKVDEHRPKYRQLIERYAAEYDLNPAFVAAIIYRESSYDPSAVSSAGAKGLMQFLPSTFEWVAPKCGVTGGDSALFEPENAVKMGCYLLRYIIRTMDSDDPILIACAYHAGWGNAAAWVQKYSSDGIHLTLDEIPKDDTKTYARRVTESYAIYLQHYWQEPGADHGAAGAALSRGAGTEL